MPSPFTVSYTGTTSGVWRPLVGNQLPFTGSGSWTLTVNRAGTTTLYSAAPGGQGGVGSIGQNGGGAGSGAFNSAGITVVFAPGKTYTIALGAYPGGSLVVTNVTDSVTISSLTGGGNGTGLGVGGAAGAVIAGAGTAGTAGATGYAGTFCNGGGADGQNAGGGAGGSGGAADDGGTGAGCGGGGINNPTPLDGYTGASGAHGVAASICGTNVGGGGGGGGEQSTFGGSSDDRFVNSGQAGIACLQLVSVP